MLPAPFPFEGMLVFAFFSVLLVAGVALRAKVNLLQRFLFPGCLIGGFLGVISLHANLLDLRISTLESFAYHFFNISFISVGLTRDEESAEKPSAGRLLRGPCWMALMQGLTFPLQAMVGGTLVLLLGLLGMKLFPTFGFLVPLGFNEGPGQALSMGKAWESLGFANGATIGITFAAVGYLFAFFVGVPLVNRGVRKGHAANRKEPLPSDLLSGLLPKGGEGKPAGRLTLHTGNAETLAFQTALVGVVYGLTYLAVRLLVRFLPPDVATILWGFFFFFGLVVALLVKKIMQWVGVDYLADPGIQRRITGWSVDYLVVATVTAIQFQIIWQYILPIALMALLNGVLTTLLVVWFGKRLDTYPLERIAAIYGTVTGTVSCGLLLLRIADPDFRTPVAFELALMNVLVLPIVGGGTMLVNGPLWWGWSVGFTISVFAAIMALCLLLLRLMGFWGAGIGPRSRRKNVV